MWLTAGWTAQPAPKENVETIRRLARLEQGVVFTDLSAEPITSVTSSIVYYLHPGHATRVTLLSPGNA